MKQKLQLLSLSIFMFFSQACYAATEHVVKESSIFAKFFSAMAGVLVSVLAIWLGLKIYKKFALKDNSKFDKINYNTNLESPKDFREAINVFLEKTDRT